MGRLIPIRDRSWPYPYDEIAEALRETGYHSIGRSVDLGSVPKVPPVAEEPACELCGDHHLPGSAVVDAVIDGRTWSGPADEYCRRIRLRVPSARSFQGRSRWQRLRAWWRQP